MFDLRKPESIRIAPGSKVLLFWSHTYLTLRYQG